MPVQFSGSAVDPGFGAPVVGMKEVEAAFGKLTKSFTPSVKAEILLDGAEVIAEEARDNVLRLELVQEGNLYNAIEPYKINQWAAGVRVRVVYAAVHEFGLERQPITPKQRRFFWAMWMETEEPMWKALALSVTYTIPARPYLRPAIDTAKRAAIAQIARSMGSYLTRLAGIGGMTK